VLLGPVGEPERQLVEPDVTQRLLRNRCPRAMPSYLMCENTRYVMQHETEADVLQHRAMRLLQDVLQVHLLIVAHLADVGVEAWLPGALAHLAGDLGEILRLELTAVDPLQPAFAAHL